MIKVTRYTRRGIVEGSVNDIHPAGKFVWVDCYNPSPEEIKVISDKTGIPAQILKNSMDDDLRPRAIDVRDYSELIFKAYYAKKKGQHDVANFSVFTNATRSNLIILRRKKIKAIEELNKLPSDNKISLMNKGIGYLLYRICDQVLDEFFEVLDDIQEEIDHLEEKIFRIRDKKILSMILHTKKTLIYFYRALSANREAIANIQKEFISGIEKKNTRIFRDLYSSCSQLIDIVSTYRELITGALEIHMSATSNNLSEVMKLLSGVAAIIMVPTLITGIYGMNFKYMPELAWQWGYPLSLLAMVLCAVVLFIIFRKKQWV